MCVCLEIFYKCSQETVDNHFLQGMRLEIQGGRKTRFSLYTFLWFLMHLCYFHNTK